MTISLAMIVKNEERCLARCLESIKGAFDEIVIVDTGSNDDTKNIARRYTDRIYDFVWQKDFAAARQFAFDQATGDWVVWLDADDIVMNANRVKRLAETAKPDVGGFYWRYIYDRDDSGNIRCEFWRERCVRNDGSFRWEGRIHEVLVPKQPRNLVQSDEVVVVHHPDPNRSDEKQRRNLEILESEYESRREASPPRLLFCLASEYSTAGEWPKALSIFKQYLSDSSWGDERYLAQTRVAGLHRALGDYEQAIEADLQALRICPHWPDAYFSLARTYYEIRDWHKVIHWTEVGRAMPLPSTIHIINPMDYRFNWIIYYTNALYRVGETREALDSTRQALEICADDPWHRENFLFFARELQRQDTPAIAGDILRQDNAVTIPPGDDGLPSIGFVCPLDWEPWSPRILNDRGCGGSETAAIQMAESLSRLGHRVSVFNQNDGEGCHEGVSYVDHRRFNPRNPPDILIAWRYPELADFGEIGWQRYLWMHDIDVGERLTPERAKRFTGILALSETHKEHLLRGYPFLDPNRLLVTRNGLDLTRFDQTVERRGQQLIYSSSPDRGLDILLKMFPKIKEQCPDATLHVFHGWADLDRTAQFDPGIRAFKGNLALLLDQPGVAYHGQVNQRRLALEMLASALWVYPTYFTETSCITAMEAQAAGAIPVTRRLAALAETVKFGMLIDGDVQTPDVQTRYIEKIVSLLQNTAKQEQIRKEMVPWACAAFGWDDVAAEWRRLFTSNATRLDQHDAGTLIVEAGWQTTMTDPLEERVLL